jgi:hypothetical protein
MENKCSIEIVRIIISEHYCWGDKYHSLDFWESPLYG